MVKLRGKRDPGEGGGKVKDILVRGGEQKTTTHCMHQPPPPRKKTLKIERETTERAIKERQSWC